MPVGLGATCSWSSDRWFLPFNGGFSICETRLERSVGYYYLGISERSYSRGYGGVWGSVLKRPHRVLLTSMYLLLYTGKRKILRQREAPLAQMIKNLPAMQDGFNSWAGKIPWGRKWQPTPANPCLWNSMEKGAGGLQSMDRKTVWHGSVTKQQQQLLSQRLKNLKLFSPFNPILNAWRKE